MIVVAAVRRFKCESKILLFFSLFKCVCVFVLGHRTTAITGFVHLKKKERCCMAWLRSLLVYTLLFYGVHISFELVLECIYLFIVYGVHLLCFYGVFSSALVFMVCVLLEIAWNICWCVKISWVLSLSVFERKWCVLCCKWFIFIFDSWKNQEEEGKNLVQCNVLSALLGMPEIKNSGN